MLRAAVLEAIAHAAAGDERSAWRALDTMDPLLRPLARRRLRLAWEDALLDAGAAAAGEGGAVHVWRVAWWRVARGRPRPAPVAGGERAAWSVQDAAAVAALHRRGARRRRRRGWRTWWPSASAVVLALVLLAAGAHAIARLLRPPARADASRRPAPASTGAYLRGGVPASDPLVARALRDDLPAFLVLLDEWVRAGNAPATPADAAARRAALEPRLAAAAARLASPALHAALGARAAFALERVVADLRAAASATPAAAAAAAARRLLDDVGAFDDALAARDLGYYLDGDLVVDRGAGGRHVVLYAFEVVHVDLLSVDGEPLRALSLRRLDGLNAEQAVLGFSRPHLRDALVVLDEVDESLVGTLLPALALDARWILCDEDAHLARSPWSVATSARAAEIARAELGAALGLDAGAAAQLGVTLGARRALFDRWRERLEQDGVVLTTPRTLETPPRFGAALAGVVPEVELAELSTLSELLADAEQARVFAAARAVIARSIRRHEAQHRADYARAVALRMPAELARTSGMLATASGLPCASAIAARDELSAYLAELARDRVTPRLNLSLVARFVLDRRQWGTPEHHAALVILDELGTELGLPPGKLVVDGRVHRASAAARYLDLSEIEPERLRAAARRLWERLFAATLPDIQ